MQKSHYLRRTFALMMAILMIITMLPMNVFAQEPNAPSTKPRAIDDEGYENAAWTLNNIPLIDMYSGETDRGTASTGIKYLRTAQDNSGRTFMEFQITQVGAITRRGEVRERDLSTHSGYWTDLILHFDDELYSNIDFGKSYILGEKDRTTGQAKWSNFFDKEKGNKDPYYTDGKSITIPFVSMFNPRFNDGDNWKRHDAKLYLYIKDDSENPLVKYNNYLMEYRVGAVTDTNKVFFRNYIYGISNYDKREFKYPLYIEHTGSLNVPFYGEVEKKKYSDRQTNAITNAHTEIYINWETNELHVNYLYETLNQDLRNSKAQFVQLLPKYLYDSLRPINVDGKAVVAKFNHVYKQGEISWGGDQGISLFDTDFTYGIKEANQAGNYKFTADQNGSLAAFRLSEAGRDFIYPHDWDSIGVITKADNNGRPQSTNISGSRGRYTALSTSFGPLGNHVTYYIDPVKLRQNVKNIDDLVVESFFVSRGKDGTGGVLVNSDSISTPSYSKAITRAPKVNDIYDDDKQVSGTTGYANTNNLVFIEAKNYKEADDPNKQKFTADHNQAVDSSGDFTIVTIGNRVFENMEKDDKLTFETIYQSGNHFKSKQTLKKVKSRIHFADYKADAQNPDKRVEETLELPENPLFRGQEGYAETTLGDTMPENPVKEGYIFKGWASKEISASEYDKAGELKDIKQWSEDKAYKFTKESPINKTYTVYPVWEEAVKSFKIVLHSNIAGNDTTKEIEVKYGENLPNVNDLRKIALMQDQYAAIAGGKYSSNAILPNAYQTDDKTQNIGEQAVFGNNEGFNFVGWSTSPDNGQMYIENLFSNKTMLAVDGEGKDRKFFLSKVATSGKKVGQASAGKLFDEIEIKNDRIDLYAAWKPYFDITVNKTWYDVTKETKYNGINVNEILNAIAHNRDVEAEGGTKKLPTPKHVPGLAREVWVGLLYRTAVTEANNPTVTEEANYYTVKDSIEKMTVDEASSNKTMSHTWHLPSYDAYGKRISYIAVEFKDEATGKDAFAHFEQKWNNIWTRVGNNLKNPQEWDNKNIAKVQNVELDNNQGGVDAFTSATVRTLSEGGIDVEEKYTNNSRVSDKPVYTTKLLNVKSSMAYPSFRKIFHGAQEVNLVPSTDSNVQYVQFDLPNEQEPLYFRKEANGTWTRVQLSANGESFEKYTGTSPYKNEYTFAEDNSDPKNKNWILKFNLEKFPKLAYKTLKEGEKVKARYFGATPMISSVWSEQVVDKEPVTPTLNGLEQLKKVKEADGTEYVVIRALKPNADLGQFQQGVKLTLIHHGKNNEGDLLEVEAYRDKFGNNVEGKEVNDYYYFKVPVNNIKHDDKVGVHAHQDTYKDSRTTEPLTIDLEGPAITAEDRTVYRGEDIDVAAAVTTKEDAKLDSIANLPAGFELIQKLNAELDREWKLKGKTTVDKKDYKVSITASDRFGNETTKDDWTITVTDRPDTDSIDKNDTDSEKNAKQIVNIVDKDFKNIVHRIEIKKVIPGSTIKVYLYKPEISMSGALLELKVPDNQNGPFIIEIPENLGKNINDAKLYLTQTEEGKKESKSTEVAMDVLAPEVFTVEAKPGESKVRLTNVDTNDTDKIYLNVAGKKYTLEKSNPFGVWIVKNEGIFEKNINIGSNNSLEFELKTKLDPKDRISATLVDKFINPVGMEYTVPRYDAPASPSIEASNGKDNYTRVSGESPYDGQVVKIYEVVVTENPATGEEKRDYKLIGTTLVKDGKYEAKLTDPDGKKYKAGTIFGASVTVNGVESPIAEAKLVDDIIPFDPDDPDKPENPDPDNFVTISLDAGEGEFEKGTKSSFHVKKDYTVTVADFAEAKSHLIAPDKKAFDKWLLEGKAFPAEGKKFDADETIYASYKDKVIPVKPEDKDKPSPEGYVRVTFEKGDGITQITGTSYYDIKADGSLRYEDIIEAVSEDKVGDEKFVIANEYREPLIFRIGKELVVMSSYPSINTVITVSATETDAKKYNPEGIVQDVKEGDKPEAKDSIGNKDELPEGTTYEFVPTDPDTNTTGEKPVTVKVTYPDNTSEEVNTKINVVPKESIIDREDPDNTDIPDGYIRVKFMEDKSVSYATGAVKAVDIKKDILKTTKYSSIWARTKISPVSDYREPIYWYFSGATKAIKADRTIAQDVKADTEEIDITPKATLKYNVKYKPEGQDQNVVQGAKVYPKDFIKNKDDMPIGTKYEFVDDSGNPVTPDTNKIGKQDVKIKVTFPDGTDTTVPAKMNVVPKDDIIKVDDPDNTPVPDGYARVRLINGDKSLRAFEEVYDVKLEAKVTYKDLIQRAADLQPSDGYTNEIYWEMNEQALNVDTVVTSASTIKAYAVIRVLPVVQDQTVKQGETPKAEDSIKNKDDLPEGTKYEFVDDKGNPTKPDTTKPGEVKPHVKVTYPDGVVEVVGPTTITVVPDGDIIPVEPGKEDDTKTPEGYVRIKLSKDDTVVFKDGVATSYDVKADGTIKYSDVCSQVEAKPAAGYKDVKWYEGTRLTTGNELVSGTKPFELTAKAENANSIIPVKPEDEGEPTPEGYVRVTFVKGKGISEVQGTRCYDIKADGSVRYEDIIAAAEANPETQFIKADGYKDPLIYKIGKENVVMTAYPAVNTDITVFATESDANKYDPEAVEQDVKQGETPKAENSIANKDELPKDTKYEFVDDQGNTTTPNTDEVGEQPVTVKVTYPDGTSETVDTKINVVPKDDIIDVDDPDNTRIPENYIRIKLADDRSVNYESGAIRNFDVNKKILSTLKYSSIWARTSLNPANGYREPIKWYLRDDTEIDVSRTIAQDLKSNTIAITIRPEATQNDNMKYKPVGQDQKVVEGAKVYPKDFIKNKDKMPIGTKYEFVPSTPDTSKIGDQDVTVKVTFPDGTDTTVEAKMEVVPKDDIIKREDPDHTPVPKGYVRLRLINGDNSVRPFEEVYDVRLEAKVTYKDVLQRAADLQPSDGYTEPIRWEVDYVKVDNTTIDTVVDKAATFRAYATFRVLPIVQDQTVKQGETPKAEDSIKNKDELPEGTKYKFVDKDGNPVKPDTTKAGEEKPYVKVTYPDGAEEIVGPTTITVVPGDNIIPVEPEDEDKPARPGYVRVKLSHDDTVTFKADAITAYDVIANGSVRYADVYSLVDAKAKEDFKKVAWFKGEAHVTGSERVTGTENIELTAKAENAENIIEVDPKDKDKPSPDGYLRVTLKNGDASVETFEKFYDVRKEAKVFYGDVLLRAGDPNPAAGYTEPITWKKDNEALNKKNVISEASTVMAYAQLKSPKVDPIKEGDETVKVEVPEIGNKVVVTIPDPTDPTNKDKDKTITVTKDNDGKWKDESGKEIKPNDGKLEIPVDKDLIKPDTTVEVVVEDTKTDKKSDPTIVKVEKSGELERIRVGIEGLAAGIETLHIVTSVPGAKVIIKINDVEMDTINTDVFGTFAKGLESPLPIGTKIELIASKKGYNDGKFKNKVR